MTGLLFSIFAVFILILAGGVFIWASWDFFIAIHQFVKLNDLCEKNGYESWKDVNDEYVSCCKRANELDPQGNFVNLCNKIRVI